MEKFKAIFFDRDGTIAKRNEKRAKERDEYLQKVLNNNFKITPEISWEAMNKVIEKKPELNIHENLVNTIEKENEYWKLYSVELLRIAEYEGNIEEEATRLNEKFPYSYMLEPYNETVEVMKYFKEKGFKIGIISDTFPSLKETIENMNLGKYIDSYTASSLIGVFKPDPLIFNEALKSIGVTAEESIYVDDYIVESDGAREMGFTSFHIDRKREGKNFEEWEISDLRDIIEYLEKMES